MTQRILIFFTLVFVQPMFAQKEFKGIIVDAETGNPIPYVNIGIMDRGVGTVSDEEGFFHLELAEGVLGADETLLFSSIGYKSLEISVSWISWTYNKHPKILLFPSLIELGEVVVTNSNSEFVDELIGNKDYDDSNFGYWKEAVALGAELATRIKIKEGLRKLNSLGFEILHNKMDSILVRVNIYDRDRKLSTPTTNLNTSGKNILHKIMREDTYSKVDLRPYSIFVKDDFIVSLELVQAYGNGVIELAIPAEPNYSGSFRRYASQGKWQKISDSGIGYHLHSSVLVPKREAEKLKEKEKKREEKQSMVSGFVIGNKTMLSGVSVINMRTKEQVKTDNSGRFLVHAKKKDLLFFSVKGYKSKQRIVGKESTINVILKSRP